MIYKYNIDYKVMLKTIRSCIKVSSTKTETREALNNGRGVRAYLLSEQARGNQRPRPRDGGLDLRGRTDRGLVHQWRSVQRQRGRAGAW